MAMLPKTLSELLELCEQFHQRLNEHLTRGADQTLGEREQLLLDYLAVHQQKLASTLETVRAKASEEALDTWFYEYSDRHKIIHSDPGTLEFSQMSVDDIQQVVMTMHQQLIDLYEHLLARAESDSARDALGQLLQFMQSQTQTISFESGRAHEL